MRISKRAKQELDVLTEANDGILTPDAIVGYARDPETALHRHFEWDDTEAAHQYRLAQARKIIRVCVTVIEPTSSLVRVWVSLPSDRGRGGHGYRTIQAVMQDTERRYELLEMAHRDFDAFRRKYRALQELVPVFEAMDAVMETIRQDQLA